MKYAALILIFLSVQTSAHAAAIVTGKNSSVTVHNTTISADGCALLTEGRCYKIPDNGKPHNIIKDESGHYLLDGKRWKPEKKK